MDPATKKNELQKFNSLLSSIVQGNVYFVTGKNGSGKSRFFAYSTKYLHQKLKSNSSDRLICLSGTMHDKYPRDIYTSKNSIENVIYLGNKVNNNMVSDTAPFRILSYYILSNLAGVAIRRSVSKVLRTLNFQEGVSFKFRYGKNRKAEVFGSIPPQLDFDLLNPHRDPVLIRRYLDHLNAGDILLADIIFYRNDIPYGLSHLSSGEKQYLLAVLGFIYCATPSCALFYDEPENSLHPSWQLSIVKDLTEVADDMGLNATLVIATHSPLVASSVRNGKVYVCDLPSGQSWQRADLFGRASDTVLREHFHLYSARSPEVTALLNKCLAFIARNETNSSDFRKGQRELRSYNLDLSADDPLYEVVSTILRF